MQKKYVGILVGAALLLAVVLVAVLQKGGGKPGPGKEGVEKPGPGLEVQEDAFEALQTEARNMWTNGQTNATLDLLRGAFGDTQYGALQTNVYNEYWEHVRQLWGAGETNAVVDQLLGAMDDVQDPGLRKRLFSTGQEALYMAGRAEQAEERFWQMLERDAAVAALSVRHMVGYKMQNGDTNGVFEVTAKLLDEPLPPPWKEQVFGLHLNTSLDLGRFARVLELVPRAVEDFGAATGVSLVRRIAQRLVDDEKLRDAELLLSKLELAAPDDPQVAQCVASIRYEMLLKRKEWMTIEERFMSIAASLDDASLSRLFSRTCALASADDQVAVSERLCEFVLMSMKDKKKTLQQACHQWIQSQVRANLPAGIVERLEIFQGRAGVPADIVAPLFTRNFYEVMKPNDKDLLKRMIVVGEKLLATAPNVGLRNEIKLKLVDGCFAAEEYEKSLRYLEEGLPGRDEEWTAMAKSKMRAHLALEKGETDTAVKHFREFMEHVGKKEDLGDDPTTGVRYTREMTLGFNEKRIGDIYAEAGRGTDATNAYREAEALYLQALADVDKGSKSHEFVKAELAKVPGAKPYVEPDKEQETPPADESKVEAEAPVEEKAVGEEAKPQENMAPAEEKVEDDAAPESEAEAVKEETPAPEAEPEKEKAAAVPEGVEDEPVEEEAPDKDVAPAKGEENVEPQELKEENLEPQEQKEEEVEQPEGM